jgi:hypothetical protein
VNIPSFYGYGRSIVVIWLSMTDPSSSTKYTISSGAVGKAVAFPVRL